MESPGSSAKTLLRGNEDAIGRADRRITWKQSAAKSQSQAGNNSFVVNLDVTQPDLALGTDILADVLLQRVPCRERGSSARKEIQLAKSQRRGRKADCGCRAIFSSELSSRDHPLGLRPEGDARSVSRLDSKDLLAFRDRYVVARNGVIAVFGDVKATSEEFRSEQKLGALPSGELALEIRHPRCN